MRTLRLAKETVSELTTAELTSVAGAGPDTLRIDECVSGVVACPTNYDCWPPTFIC